LSVRSVKVIMGSFGPGAGIALAFLLAFGLVGGWLLAGRMLTPLARITDAIDGMLARLEAHVAEQQRFAANASHELRTPLAITQALLDVARDDPNRDGGELDDRLRCSAAAISGPSRGSASTCPSSRRRPWRRSSRSRRRTVSPSPSPVTWHRRPAHPRCCCS
jgi:signal transduction histidine kinase